MNKGQKAIYILIILFVIVVAAMLLFLRGETVASAVIGSSGGNLSCADNGLLLTIPEGALDRETTITCKAADVSELPDSVKSLGEVVSEYRLEPDGLAFKKPVMMKVPLDPSSYNVSNNKTVVTPYILLTVEGDKVEPLKNLTTVVGKGEAYVQGSAAHFSNVSKVKGGVSFEMTPSAVFLPIGSFFGTRITVINTFASRYESGADLPQISQMIANPYAMGSVAIPRRVGGGYLIDWWPNPLWTFSLEESIYVEHPFYCAFTGSGIYGFDLIYNVSPYRDPLLRMEQSLSLHGEAICEPISSEIAGTASPGTPGWSMDLPSKAVGRYGAVEVSVYPEYKKFTVGSIIRAHFLISSLPEQELGEHQLSETVIYPIARTNRSGHVTIFPNQESISTGDILEPGNSSGFFVYFLCESKGNGTFGADISYGTTPLGLDVPNRTAWSDWGRSMRVTGYATCEDDDIEAINETSLNTSQLIGGLGGIKIISEMNKSCTYAGQEARFTAVGEQEQPVSVAWRSKEFVISKTGTTLAFTPKEKGYGIITATDEQGRNASISFNVAALPESQADYDILLGSVNIAEASNRLYSLQKPVKDRYGNLLYDSLYLLKGGNPAVLRPGMLLAGQQPGSVFKLKGQDYEVTGSGTGKMYVAKAVVKALQASKLFDSANLIPIKEDVKAQYVVSADGGPQLHLFVKDSYAGYFSLQDSKQPYEITPQVVKLSSMQQGRVFWVSKISPDMVVLAVAEQGAITEIRDGEPGLGSAWVKANDPLFQHKGLSIWGEELYLNMPGTKFIPGTERTVLKQSNVGDLLLGNILRQCG